MAITWFFFVVCCLFSQAPSSRGQMQEGCPDQCSCPSYNTPGWGGVSCSLTRSGLPDISKVESVSILWLSCLKSQASIKPKPRLFSFLADKGELQKLEIYNCFKEDLADGIFDGLMTMHTLMIEYNQIKTLTPVMFDDLPNLRNLYLKRNEISKIKPQTFAGLQKLEYLYLEGNQLKRLSASAFDGLTDETFKTVYLKDNPIICDCHLEPLLNWLKNFTRERWGWYNSNWRNNLPNVCAEGNKLKGRIWESLTSREMNEICPSVIEETKTVESTTEGVEKKKYFSFLLYAVGSIVTISLFAILIFRLFNSEGKSITGYQPLATNSVKSVTCTTNNKSTKSITLKDNSYKKSLSSVSEKEKSKSKLKSKSKSSNIPKKKKPTVNSVSSSSSMESKEKSLVPKKSLAFSTSVSLSEKSKESSTISTNDSE